MFTTRITKSLSREWTRSLIMPTERLSTLKQLMSQNEILRFMECHSGLTAMICENARGANGETFHGMWSSSLTSSAIQAKPDIETVDTTARLRIVQECMEVSQKPMIYDGDTGGAPELFAFTVRRLEQLGVSAAIIEDKTGLKQNSLFGTDVKQELEDIDMFCEKIRAGKKAQFTKDFMVVARMESLIAGWGQEEALHRASKCIEAGVDAVMIHSKQKSPDEVLSFLKEYNKFERKVPIVAVPTTYNSITEEELAAHGVKICIYANHLLRAAYPAMVDVANTILTHHRSKEVDDKIMGVKPIITLFPKCA